MSILPSPKKTKDLAFNNIEFILGRAEEVLLDESFDCITSSYLAKYADLNTLVQNMRKCCAQAVFLSCTILHIPRVASLSKFGSFILNFCKRSELEISTMEDNFYGLPKLLQETKWSRIGKTPRENGFSDIHIQPLTFGTSTIVTATKR
jgi:demethylmenaquinone methyltransferase/2-methoxy-6-polyprenyl-1,4-benzoquinol methylase